MGILNVTPDSFYAESRSFDAAAVAQRVQSFIRDDVDIIDIGAYSTRPGHSNISVKEEMERIRRGMSVIRASAPEAVVSIDTFRPEVARMAVEELGVNIINDISGLTEDTEMISVAARLKVPYILMHNRKPLKSGAPDNCYENVTSEVLRELADKINMLNLAGVNDIIIDPGIGFAKTMEDNYTLLRNLRLFEVLNCPLLIGISRKSLIYKKFNINPEESLEATVALNAFCLERGASILRVHDVKAARQTVTLYESLKAC